MGRRRKRKVVKIIKPTVPKVFTCPCCGNRSLAIKIDRKSHTGSVKCGVCGVTWKTETSDLDEKIDVYHRFFDVYLSGQLS